MIESPEIVDTPAQATAVIHMTVPFADLPKVMGPAIQEVMAAVTAQGIGPAGPVCSHYLSTENGQFDFEVGVPVTAPVTPVGRVIPSALPAATVVRAVYRGPYEGLGPAWAEIYAWAKAHAHGHTVARSLWECYVYGPESNPDPATWRTVLNKPLAR